jgi:hypothetical protein
MTEEQWLAADHATPMLLSLKDTGMPSGRKLQLFAAACCRRVWHLLTDPGCRAVVEAAERDADGVGTRREVDEAREAIHGRLDAAADSSAYYAVDFLGWPAGNPRHHIAYYVSNTISRGFPAEAAEQCRLLRCVVGNPYRPVTTPPSVRTWHGGLILKLAQAAYENRDLPSGHLGPARLAVLADCLEDAGCEDAQLLGHVRGGGVHVRGCFAVDAVLGKP